MNLAGKTYIIVDVQPEYDRAFEFNLGMLCSFLNENIEIMNNLVFLYNGNDTMDMISEDDYKMWWLENGLDEKVLDWAQFYDKGYAFFRYCMDNYIDEDAIANFVRFMRDNNVNDSRGMDRELWAAYLRQHRRTDKKELYELLKHADDMVHIPDLMDYIERYRNIVLTGGGVTECLKEVEIALKALRIPYEIDHRFTY